MTRLHSRIRRQGRKGQRGQAMVEYSVLNWVLVVGLILMMTVQMIPGPKAPNNGPVQRRNIIEMFLDAEQIYYNSFYHVLDLPLP